MVEPTARYTVTAQFVVDSRTGQKSGPYPDPVRVAAIWNHVANTSLSCRPLPDRGGSPAFLW